MSRRTDEQKEHEALFLLLQESGRAVAYQCTAQPGQADDRYIMLEMGRSSVKIDVQMRLTTMQGKTNHSLVDMAVRELVAEGIEIAYLSTGETNKEGFHIF